jgi:type II secretion system protein J
MNIKKNLHRRAFTLVEIMVALAIFTMLVAAVYSTWIVILKSSQVGQEAAARIQRQRIAVRTIEDSLTCIQSFQGSFQYYSFILQNGDQPELSFVARLPDIFPRNGRFDSNLRRLTFTVEPDADSGNDLMLRQNEILKDMDSDEQAAPLVIARNVKNFLVECWDTNALDWTQEWDDTNAIPPMVRVTLAFVGNGDSGGNGPTMSITREITMPSSTVLTVQQVPRVGGGNSPVRKPNPNPGNGNQNGGNPNNNFNNGNNPYSPRTPFNGGRGNQQ